MGDGSYSGKPSAEGAPAGPSPPNKIFLHSGFRSTVDALKVARISLPPKPIQPDFSLDTDKQPWDRPLFQPIESSEIVELDSARGFESLMQEPTVTAYDESVRKFAALEGTAFLISHSIVTTDHRFYLPQVMLAFHFYTRAGQISAENPSLQQTDNATRASEEDYTRDKLSFLQEEAPSGSLLFLDGPLIAGDAYTLTIQAIPSMHARNILPVFVVKNSESDIVVRNSETLSRRYNSDLHWANSLLKPGQRTRLFRYTDQHNPRNSKVFCYIKSLPGVPLRVEFHPTTFERDTDRSLSALEVAHYLALVQGSHSNPQLRLVAIAEMYARAAISLLRFDRLVSQFDLTPTVNQARFGG